MPDFKTPEAFADSVVLAIKSALGPVLERLAAAEARLAPLGDVRDRVVTMETKAAIQPTTDPRIDELSARLQPEAFADMVVLTVKAALGQALGPVLERLAAAEAMIASLPAAEKTVAEIRDRVVAVETKAAIPAAVWPSQPDLDPVLARLAATEVSLATLGDLRDRVVTVETKAAMSSSQEPALVEALDRLLTIETQSHRDLAPVLERIAATEARLAVLGDLRDRVVTVETKASLPQQDAAIGDLREKIAALSEGRSAVTQLGDQVSALSDMVTKDLAELRLRLGAVETKEDRLPMPSIDLGPLGERLAAAEARLSTLGDLRDRVVAVETKSAIPLPLVEDPIDIAPFLERLSAAETRLSVLGDLRDRVVTIETKSALPLAVQPSAEAIDVRDRLITLETHTNAEIGNILKSIATLEDIERKDAIRLEGYTSCLQRDTAALSERVAVGEVRAQVPGPAGKDGADGQHGKDGADGLGFEDMDVQFDGDRTIALKFARGHLKKTWPITFPFLRYQGVFQEGKSYDVGDVVTWAGSTWHAGVVTTIKPGEGSKDWTLCVKRGRDGRDGRDPSPSLPVVSVGISTKEHQSQSHE